MIVLEKNIIVYTTPICPMCEKAKNFLEQEGYDYQEVDITKDKDKRDELIEKTGQTNVPVIEISDEVIIGFNKNKMLEALKD